MSRASMPVQERRPPSVVDPPSLQPMNAPLVRVDSGVVCESCGMHVDSMSQCRCSS